MGGGVMVEEAIQSYLSSIVLLAIRFGTALRLTPFFGGSPLGLLPWLALSVFLACLLVPPSGSPATVAEIGSGAWFGLAAMELFVGLTLGVIVRLAFSVLEVAGDLARLGTVSIPDVGQDSFSRGSPLSRIYTLLAAAAFLLLGGHHAVLAGLGSTVRCYPPGVMPVSFPWLPVDASTVIGLFAAAMAMGVLVSTPVFVAGIAADIFGGFISRFTSGATPFRGGHGMRAAFVQVMIVIALGAVVATALGVLQDGVEKLAICKRISP